MSEWARGVMQVGVQEGRGARSHRAMEIIVRSGSYSRSSREALRGGAERLLLRVGWELG